MRRLNRLCLVIFTWAIVASPTQAEVSVEMEDIASRLETSSVVRVPFIQSRHMEILSKPIVTEGHLIFSLGEGIAWLISAPFKTNIVLTETHVTEWGEQGERRRTPLSARPGLASLVSILVPLLSADFGHLEENFIVDADLSDTEWQAVLTPRDEAMAEVIFSIEISGNVAVREISVREWGGDWTHLVFGEYSPGVDLLTVEERDYFGE